MPCLPKISQEEILQAVKEIRHRNPDGVTLLNILEKVPVSISNLRKHLDSMAANGKLLKSPISATARNLGYVYKIPD